MLALALHALAPLAASAASAAPAGLHDFCTSTPSSPAPDGGTQADHCAFCVQPAAISGQPVSFQAGASPSKVQPARAVALAPWFLHLAAPSRAPPTGA
ncbi:MAG TPA: hypothetical protein VGI18_12065 [Burkholderiales bacterium]